MEKIKKEIKKIFKEKYKTIYSYKSKIIIIIPNFFKIKCFLNNFLIEVIKSNVFHLKIKDMLF